MELHFKAWKVSNEHYDGYEVWLKMAGWKIEEAVIRGAFIGRGIPKRNDSS